MAVAPRYSEVIARVATHYWGAPNSSLSRSTELRFGSHGSKSVDLDKATWFDHEANLGGGVADLVKREEPGASVVDRLEEFGLPKNEKPFRRETVWDYVDEAGEIRYQVVRIDDVAGKTYRQRRIDPNGKPVWSMHGVTTLPHDSPHFHGTRKSLSLGVLAVPG
jgi:hypothetical protein